MPRTARSSIALNQAAGPDQESHGHGFVIRVTPSDRAGAVVNVARALGGLAARELFDQATHRRDKPKGCLTSVTGGMSS